MSDYEIKKSTIGKVHFFIVPFIIGASYEFFPLWISVPISVILCIDFVGACLLIAKGD